MTKPKRHLDLRGRSERAAKAKAANKREAEIAKQYFNAGPSIGNLARAAYHWYNSVPMLGGQNESGLDLQTGETPIPNYTSGSVAKNSVTLAERVLQGIKGKPSDAYITKYKELREFLKSPDYNRRLGRYLRSVGREGETKMEVRKQLNNIEAAKVAVVPKGYIVDADGSLVKARGMYSTKEHLIQVEDVNLGSTTPKHEMIHARNRGKAYANNAKYKMRTKAEQQLNKDIAEGNIMENSPKADALKKDIRYYGDVVEQEPRVLNTLAHMRNEGYDINNLKDEDIIEYFDAPIDLFPRDTQSLFENYVWEDIPNALRNFKNVTAPIILTGAGYGIGKRYLDEQRPQERNGGSIHIKPSKRGTFTAAATKHGMSVQEFASKVLRNKEDYSPSLVKKANFARNASKWH